MKKNLLFCSFLLSIYTANAQYDVVYENSFRNWLPGQGWIMINNDTISRTPGLLTEYYLTETIQYTLGSANTSGFGYTQSPSVLSGICDKIMLSPPISLTSNPYLRFFSKHNAGSEFSVWIVQNENDTTLNGLTDSLGISSTNGFNVLDLNSVANDTIRIAFRLRGINSYGYIDDIFVLNKNALAYVPDGCFRNYLMTAIPGAFVGDSLDYLHSSVLNTTQLFYTNGCINSLEGLQFFPFLKNIDFSFNSISYIPFNTLSYLDSIHIKNNLLTYLPTAPRCVHLDFDNNLVNKISWDYFNNYCYLFHGRNNLVFDCLPGTNRFVQGDMCGNISVDFGGYTYYYMNCYYTPIPVPPCSQTSGFIFGTVYYDINQNGIRDSADILLVNQRVSFLQGPDLITNSLCEYSVAMTPGYVNMNVTQLPSYFSCSNPLADSVSAQQTINHDFRIVAASSTRDLGVNVNGTGTTRIGELLVLNLTVRNYGTDTTSGTTKMFIPPGYTFVGLTSGTIINDTLVWTTTVNPFGSVNNMLQIIINSYPANVSTRFRARVTVTGDTNLINNKDSLNTFILPQLVPESPWDDIPPNAFPFDPNNKLVSTPRVPEGYSGYLIYNINFQNIGTANATRVMVRDSLNAMLDCSTFEFIASSHPCIVSLGTDSILQFLFQPIVLTPDSVDSLNSHGHIWFRIKPTNPVQFGDTIRNHASIYFDNQPAVITDACKVWAVNQSSFTAANTVICASGNMQFTSQSSANATSYQWLFPGGTPSTSTAQNPVVFYSNPGLYDVALITSWGAETDTMYQEGYMTVHANPLATISPSGPTTFCSGNSLTLTANVANNYLWSDNSATQSINVTSSGNYAVTITDANGCTASTSLSVTVNPLPPASITPSGPTTFCAGNSVTLTSSAANSYSWSNSSATQSVNVTTSGNYIVTVTDANNCTATSSAISVTVNPLPSASIIPSGPTTFCAGNSVTLTSSAANSYSWSNSSATQSINVSSSGNYIVTVTDGNNCSSSASQNVTVNPLPNASIAPSGPTTFCAGNSVTLTANAASSYLWSNNSATQSINVTSSGNYTVTVTDANNCSSASPATSVTVNPNPPVPAITQSGDSLISDAANGYQWYFNSVLIPGATSQSYYPLQNGNYSVVITDANNCTASSIDYPFILTETGGVIGDNEILIYPNPARGELVVRSNGFGDNSEITICNLLGESLFSQKLKANSQQQVLDVSALPRGIYFIRVKMEEKIVMQKIVLM